MYMRAQLSQDNIEKSRKQNPNQIMCQGKRISSTPQATKPAVFDTDSVKGHPVTLEDFYQKHPSFVWGPLLFAGLLHVATTKIPTVVNFLQEREMQAFGWMSALQYTVWSIVMSYAFHGFFATHAPAQLKIQADKEYRVKPKAMAIRSTAALLTELIYACMPLAPATDTWIRFATWSAAIAVYWDFHFFIAHKYCHENKAAYRFFHKMHHLCKEPNCFGAYFVTYQSHIILEQAVVLILAIAGLPRDVFIFTMYWGTMGTFVEHSGYELGSMKLPLIPVTFGMLQKVMGFATCWFLEGTCCFHPFNSFYQNAYCSLLKFQGVNVAEHDWHHEKFVHNYSLSFKYLDKLFGSYHPGKEPGVIDSLKTEKGRSAGFKPTWSALNQASEKELDFMSKMYQKDQDQNQVRRMLDLLIDQKGDHTKLGAPVDLYTHGLQTATRALQAGEDDDMVVAALFHDVGELFVPASHGDFSSSLLRPYVSKRVCWILEHHEIFQMKNYGPDGCHLDVIEMFRGNKYFDDCEKFCADYDQPSFDPDFEHFPLEDFLPIVERVFSRRPFWHSPGHPKLNCVIQLDD